MNDFLEALESVWPYAAGGLVVLTGVIYLLSRKSAAKPPEVAAKAKASEVAAKPPETKQPAKAKGSKSTAKIAKPAAKQPEKAAKPDPTKPAATKPTAPRSRSVSGTEQPLVRSHVLILAREIHATPLCEAIATRCVRVKTATELVSIASKQRPAAVFVDLDLLPQLEGKLPDLPLVVILDGTPAEALTKSITLLGANPNLAHVIAAPLLSTALGRAHLKSLVDRLANGPEHDLLDTASVGRVAMLKQASRREARFERMQEYFSKQGLSSRTIAAIYEVAEELVMNALYNAPAEAGYFKAPVSRMEDVTLPLDRACEISYGIEAGNAFVRLRDTFGALKHQRLLEVLNRCNSSAVTLDESRGGAGLGMWRVFSAATTIAITVIPGRLTDILIRMAPKQGKSAKQLLAVDLYFFPDTNKAAVDALVLEQDHDLLDKSITIMQN